ARPALWRAAAGGTLPRRDRRARFLHGRPAGQDRTHQSRVERPAAAAQPLRCSNLRRRAPRGAHAAFGGTQSLMSLARAKRGAPPLAFTAIDVRLENRGEEHSIGVAARPPEGLGTLLKLSAQLTGLSVSQPAGWSGKAYAELGYTDAAAWRPWIDYPFDLH